MHAAYVVLGGGEGGRAMGVVYKHEVSDPLFFIIAVILVPHARSAGPTVMQYGQNQCVSSIRAHDL